MNAGLIEQMRIDSRRIGTTEKSIYHAGAMDMQDHMIEKAYHALEKVLAKELLDELVNTLKEG